MYPNGLNAPPAAYLAQGIALAQSVVPRDAGGQPNANGKTALLSVGMSNTSMEFAVFKTTADSDTLKNSKLVIVNGAQGAVDAEQMKSSSSSYWTTWVPQQLSAAGVTGNQVQTVWLKNALANPNYYGGFPAAAQRLQTDLQSIVQILASTFPNLQIVYLASRIYAGYATVSLNPEPYAYESGFSVKWLIEDRIQNSPATRPWLAWGPYLWTNGTAGRSDGLIWSCNDVNAGDGTHPSLAGEQKVAALLLSFLKTNSTAQPWFAPSFSHRTYLPLMAR